MVIFLKLDSLKSTIPNWKRPVTKSGIQKHIAYGKLNKQGTDWGRGFFSIIRDALKNAKHTGSGRSVINIRT